MAERLFNETQETARENAKKWANRTYYRMDGEGTLKEYKYGQFMDDAYLFIFKPHTVGSETTYRRSGIESFLGTDPTVDHISEEKGMEIKSAIETKLKPLIGKTLYRLNKDGQVDKYPISERSFDSTTVEFSDGTLFIDPSTMDVTVSRYVPIPDETGSEDNNYFEIHRLGEWGELSVHEIDFDEDGNVVPDEISFEALYTFDKELLNQELAIIKSETNK